MALTFLGTSSFTQVGPEIPRTNQYGLDQLDVPFDGALTGLTTYVAGLTRGTAWSGDSNLYLTDWSTDTHSKQYPIVTLTYTGARGGTLPPVERESGGAVASATTNTSALIFPSTATNPASATFYAPFNAISFISTDPGDITEPDDPAFVTNLITWDLGFGVQPGYSFPAMADFILNSCFVQSITEAEPEIKEVVSGRYYHITKRKTRTLFPYAPPT
jgi:hypothetical protein